MPRAQNQMEVKARRKLLFLAAILALWSLLIVGRLIQVQIVERAKWEDLAQRQQQRDTNLTPPRGKIIDRNGKVLALSVPVETVFASTRFVPDLREKLTLVANICGVNPAEVIARCEGKPFCYIASKVDAATAARVRELKLTGIGFEPDVKRSYPNQSLGAHVLGNVGANDRGASGLEQKYDEVLVGEPGRVNRQVDARGTYIDSVVQQPEPGQNIILTIDQHIQYVAEQELARAMKETSARSGTVIVENPHTGEILALANSPTFDPNHLQGVDPRSMQNPAVSFPYEPGSTFKIITVAAALEEKVTTPQEMIDCGNGSIVVGRLRIHDHKKYSALSVSDVIANSSDVGAIRLAQRLGDRLLYHYILGFGVGARTGIELPSETRGMTRPPEKWNPSSIGAISMGQEIGLSAVQLTAVVATIANDGIWTAPRIVAAQTPPANGMKTVQYQPVGQRRVISTLTAAQMKLMLQGVVLHGTGTKATLQGYTSAGKTGTAQRKDDVACAAAARHEPGAKCRYSKTDYVGTFAGFAPLNNPAIVVVVVLDSAKGLHQGGQVSAPVFARIAQNTLAYLKVAPDVDLPMSRQMLMAMKRSNAADLNDGPSDTLGEPLEVAQDEQPAVAPAVERTPANGVKPVNLPVHPGVPGVPATNSQAVSAGVSAGAAWAGQPLQTPEDSRKNASGGGVVMGTANDVVVPSFLGKGMRYAIAEAQALGLEVDLHGNGVVREQAPAPGSRVQPGSHIAVRLGR